MLSWEIMGAPRERTKRAHEEDARRGPAKNEREATLETVTSVARRGLATRGGARDGSPALRRRKTRNRFRSRPDGARVQRGQGAEGPRPVTQSPVTQSPVTEAPATRGPPGAHSAEALEDLGNSQDKSDGAGFRWPGRRSTTTILVTSPRL